jgi:hypothetical protein
VTVGSTSSSHEVGHIFEAKSRGFSTCQLALGCFTTLVSIRHYPKLDVRFASLSKYVFRCFNQCCQLAEISAAKHKSGPIKISATGRNSSWIVSRFSKNGRKVAVICLLRVLHIKPLNICRTRLQCCQVPLSPHCHFSPKPRPFRHLPRSHTINIHFFAD